MRLPSRSRIVALRSRNGAVGVRIIGPGTHSVGSVVGGDVRRVSAKRETTARGIGALGIPSFGPLASGPRSTDAAPMSAGRGGAASTRADLDRPMVSGWSSTRRRERSAMPPIGSRGSSRMGQSRRGYASATAATTRRAATPRISSWGRGSTTTMIVTRRGARTGRAGRIIPRGSTRGW